jgi:hypothetical protein
MMKSPALRLISCLALVVAFATAARANILLTIDWSNLSAVKVTATGNAPAFSYNNGEDAPVWAGGASSFKGEDGMTFVNFLTSASATFGDVGPAATSSTLSDYSGTNIFNQFYILNTGTQNGSGKDFNIYATVTSSNYLFANGQPAFTGEAVFDLSGAQYSTLVSLLPAQGASGNLVMWNTFDYPLGTWSVTGAASAVPEPSTYALIFGLGALGLAAWRRRSQSVQS